MFYCYFVSIVYCLEVILCSFGWDFSIWGLLGVFLLDITPVKVLDSLNIRNAYPYTKPSLVSRHSQNLLRIVVCSLINETRQRKMCEKNENWKLHITPKLCNSYHLTNVINHLQFDVDRYRSFGSDEV